MSDPALALVMLGVLVFTIMVGFPVAFTMMALGVGFGYYAYYQAGQAFFDNRVFYLLTQNTYGVMTNDTLVSIPLFLMMGYMVERANILDRLFYSLQVAARHVPGALAVAAIATCALFATATGIVGAVVTLMGLLAFPQMLKAGYDIRYASGAICAGGCLGILIPPSILLIVYGAQAGVSVVRLYAGALLPGLLLAGLYILYLVVLAWFKPQLAPKLPKEQTNVSFGRTILLLLTSFFPLAILILSVLGTIMFGLATPTEAAAVGALGSILLALGYRALTWSRLKEAVYLTARTSAMVCWLFVGSATFAAIFAYLGGACRFVRTKIEAASVKTGEPLSAEEVAALDAFEEVARDPALRLDMDFQVGDIQLINNYTVLHARTEFEDWPEPERKRHLLRLWLTYREAPVLPKGFPRHLGYQQENSEIAYLSDWREREAAFA